MAKKATLLMREAVYQFRLMKNLEKVPSVVWIILTGLMIGTVVSMGLP